MTMFRPRRTTALLLAAATVLASCGGNGDATITLIATSSSGDDVDVSYSIDGETTTATVDTPWELTVDVGGRFEVELTVTNRSGDGRVGCGFGGDAGGPEGDGPGGAECNLSGSASGNTLSTSGFSRAIPRDADAVATGDEHDDEAVVDETSGEADVVQVLVELTTADGVVETPTQNQRIGVRVRVTGVDITSDDIVVWTTSEFDDGATINKVSKTTSYEFRDVGPTGLIHQIAGFNDYAIGRTGTYRLTVEGAVTIGDDKYPIDETRSFEVEEASVEVEEASFNDGTFELELPTSWDVIEDNRFDTFRATEFGGTSDFVDSIQKVLVLRAIDGSGDFRIFRSNQPRTLVGLDAAVASLRAASEPADLGEPIDVEFDGSSGVRLMATVEDNGVDIEFVAEFIRLDGEVLLIQQKATAGSSTVDEIRAIRDSLVIDPSGFPALAHSVQVSLATDGTSDEVATVSVPADWSRAGDGTFVSPDESRSLEVTTTAESLTNDELIERLAALTGIDPVSIAILKAPGELAFASAPSRTAGPERTFSAATSRSGVTIIVMLTVRDDETRSGLLGEIISSIQIG